MNQDKRKVHDFWNRAACGEALYLADEDRAGYRAQSKSLRVLGIGVGLMLWIRYALLGVKPWLSLREIYACYLKSPGAKAYSAVVAGRRIVHVD